MIEYRVKSCFTYLISNIAASGSVEVLARLIDASALAIEEPQQHFELVRLGRAVDGDEVVAVAHIFDRAIHRLRGE